MMYKSILDVFTRIKSDADAIKPDLCISLFNHLFRHVKVPGEENENDLPQEVTYVLRRLIQGLGSPRQCVRKCYFSTLSTLLSNFHHIHHKEIDLEYFKSIVDNRLSKYESKKEEGEIFVGQVLAYGATIRSGIIMKSSPELQQSIFQLLVQISKEKSYLPLLVYMFIFEYISKVDKQMFKSALWPVLRNEISSSVDIQTFEQFTCSMMIYEKYPVLMKNLSIFTALRKPDSSNIDCCFKMMTNVTSVGTLQHPFYETYVCYLIKHDRNKQLINELWNKKVDTLLRSDIKRMQLLSIFKFLDLLIVRINFDMIDSLLTPSTISVLLEHCNVQKPGKMFDEAQMVLKSLLKRCLDDGKKYPSDIFNIFSKIVLDTGRILVDRDTGVKIVVPLISEMNEEYVMKLAVRLEEIIISNGRSWNFISKRYAVHLLARLLLHPTLQNTSWKIKQLKFFITHALFSTDQNSGVINNELAGVMKTVFFNSLNHKMRNISVFRNVLIEIVAHIDQELRSESHQPRSPLTDDFLKFWKQFLRKTNRISTKIKDKDNEASTASVFHVLFLQMSLYLFIDFSMAKDALMELEKCYEKAEEGNHFKNNTEDPNWIEVIVELFLSWLSRDTSFFRNLICLLFPYLCDKLTAQATYQILQILDPHNTSDILISERENDEAVEGDSEDDDNDESSNDEQDVQSDSDLEDNDDYEETAMDKMRAAVHEALGLGGSVTDTESLDLNDLDEKEGQKLDVALSAAFKSLEKPKTKTKTQPENERILTNFRIRVLDLCDIILDNNPPLSSVLEMLSTLFNLLKFCIKDKYQKQLEIRTRGTLKKIGHLKKCCRLEEVDNQLIVSSLKNLLEKGDNTIAIFMEMTSHISDCSIFLVRMFLQKLSLSADLNDRSFIKAVLKVYRSTFENFFTKRDHSLPVVLLENILTKIPLKENIELYNEIAGYAFNSSIRLFKRKQALSFLVSLYKNKKLLLEFSPNDVINLEKKLSKNIQAFMNAVQQEDKIVNENFVSTLWSLLYTIKTCTVAGEGIEWECVISFLTRLPNQLNLANCQTTRKSYRRLCSLLKVPLENKIKYSNLDGELSNNKSADKTNSRCNGQFDNNVKVSTAENVKRNLSNKKRKRKNTDKIVAKKIRSEIVEGDFETFCFSKVPQPNENI